MNDGQFHGLFIRTWSQMKFLVLFGQIWYNFPKTVIAFFINDAQLLSPFLRRFPSSYILRKITGSMVSPEFLGKALISTFLPKSCFFWDPIPVTSSQTALDTRMQTQFNPPCSPHQNFKGQKTKIICQPLLWERISFYRLIYQNKMSLHGNCKKIS